MTDSVTDERPGAAGDSAEFDNPGGDARMEALRADAVRLEAVVIFDSYLPEALRRALDYAGDDGFVAPRNVSTSLRDLPFTH